MREETRSAEWYADLARDVMRYRTREVSLWQDPELAGVQQRRADEGWNEAWANQYRARRRSAVRRGAVLPRREHRQQAERRREEEEQRDRELRQAQALARERRRLAVVLTLVAVGSLVAAFWMYRQAEIARTAQAAAETAEADATNSRAAAEKLAGQLTQLNQLLEQEKQLASSATASAADRARLQQEIEAVKAQAEGSQAALSKAREAEQAGRSETQRAETLQQQLTSAAAERDKATAERDRLQAQVSAMQGQVAQGATAAERAATLQGLLEEERKRSAAADAEIARLKTQLEAAASRGSGSGSASAPTQRHRPPTTAGRRPERLPTGMYAPMTARNWAAGIQYHAGGAHDGTRACREPPKEVRPCPARGSCRTRRTSYLAVALLPAEGRLRRRAGRAHEGEPSRSPHDLRTELQAGAQAVRRVA